jgi:hypothetical protein
MFGHRAAAEYLTNRGLSPTARYALAIFSIIAGLMMLINSTISEKPIAVLFAAAFCFLITLACFSWGRVRQFFGSLIAGAVFSASLWFPYEQLTSGELLGSNFAGPSIVKSLMFFFAFGIPSLAYLWKARFGFRRKSMVADSASHLDPEKLASARDEPGRQ